MSDETRPAEEIHRVRRRFHSTLIAMSRLLQTPYSDAPEWTPWTRFVKPMVADVDALFDRVERECAELREERDRLWRRFADINQARDRWTEHCVCDCRACDDFVDALSAANMEATRG